MCSWMTSHISCSLMKYSQAGSTLTWVFFLVMAVLMVAILPLIKLLRRIREEHTRQIVRSILYTSMHRLGNQFVMIGRILQRNGAAQSGDADNHHGRPSS